MSVQLPQLGSKRPQRGTLEWHQICKEYMRLTDETKGDERERIVREGMLFMDYPLGDKRWDDHG